MKAVYLCTTTHNIYKSLLTLLFLVGYLYIEAGVFRAFRFLVGNSRSEKVLHI